MLEKVKRQCVRGFDWIGAKLMVCYFELVQKIAGIGGRRNRSSSENTESVPFIYKK